MPRTSVAGGAPEQRRRETPTYADAAGTGSREGGTQTIDPRDEDELVHRTVGAFTGLSWASPWEDEEEEPTLEQPWASDIEILRPGDRALASAVIGGVDNEGDRRADERAIQSGADPRAMDTNLLQLARSQLGVDYVWAASDPGEGFDCSGFTQWVLKRYGIQTQHMASLQQQQFQKIGREQLQPGDLVFFNYGRKAAGVADHVGLYIGNGQMIDASSSADQIVERGVDWDHFLHGGATGIGGEATIGSLGGESAGPRKRKRSKPEVESAGEGGFHAASMLALGSRAQGNAIADVAYAVSTQRAGEEPRTPSRDASFGGSHGDIKSELYRGFMDAGRPDLANMVGTDAFNTWINQESGWRPGVTSPANNHGLANDGLFQVWRGHSYNAQGQVASMSPYDQARLVARHFSHLDPGDIRRYADQINNGTYGGWG